MRCPSQRGPADNSAWPNPWAPVPQSRTISAPSSPRTSTHDVLPPWRSVIRPGLAKDPRVPQNRISILVPLHLRGAAPRTPVAALPQQLVSGNERTTTTRPPLIVVWLVRSVKRLPSRSPRVNGHRLARDWMLAERCGLITAVTITTSERPRRHKQCRRRARPTARE